MGNAKRNVERKRSSKGFEGFKVRKVGIIIMWVVKEAIFVSWVVQKGMK